jgi:spoIIIJ-associated protein
MEVDQENTGKNREASIAFAKKYAEDVVSFFGANVDVYATADEDVIELNVPSTYLNNVLIGRNGETLRGLQYLISSTLRQKEFELTRVNIDIADYKKHHNDRIAEQAEKWAQEVMETGKPMSLRPMNPAERRVVHKVLTDYAQLSSESEGEGRDRHIVLKKIL